MSLVSDTMSSEPPFDFIMSVYLRPESCFSADNPISLKASTHQVSFRKIMNLRLKRLLTNSDPPVLLAVKLILGSAHLSRDEYPRDNTSISSRFVASLLDQKLPKQMVWNLTRELSPVEILQELQEVLNKALHDSGAPRSSNQILFNAHGALINYYPFLLDLKGKELNRHRAFTSGGLSYLKWRFLGEDPEAQGKEEILFQFARLNGFLPLIAVEAEPKPDQSCRADPSSGHGSKGRSRGPSASRGRGCPRKQLQQLDISSSS